ncbi:hypothetical protein quinque_015686 [Culex quinquefasciatus]
MTAVAEVGREGSQVQTYAIVVLGRAQAEQLRERLTGIEFGPARRDVAAAATAAESVVMPVEVVEHPFRNSVRCVVGCRDVDHLDDEELLHELAAQGVSGIYRQPAAAKPAGREKRLNASGQPFKYSGLMVLTVRGTSQPTHVQFGPLRVVARPYRMRPLQCRRCWRFGHKEVRSPDLAAGKSPVCGRCSERQPPAAEASEAGNGSSAGTCQKPARCSRCGNGAGHGVGSPRCPIYQREAEIADFRTGMAGGGSFAAAAQAVDGLRERKHQPQPQQRLKSVLEKETLARTSDLPRGRHLV